MKYEKYMGDVSRFYLSLSEEYKNIFKNEIDKLVKDFEKKEEIIKNFNETDVDYSNYKNKLIKTTYKTYLKKSEKWEFIVDVDNNKKEFIVFNNKEDGVNKRYRVPFAHIDYRNKSKDIAYIKVIENISTSTLEFNLKNYDQYVKKYGFNNFDQRMNNTDDYIFENRTNTPQEHIGKLPYEISELFKRVYDFHNSLSEDHKHEFNKELYDLMKDIENREAFSKNHNKDKPDYSKYINSEIKTTYKSYTKKGIKRELIIDLDEYTNEFIVFNDDIPGNNKLYRVPFSYIDYKNKEKDIAYINVNNYGISSKNILLNRYRTFKKEKPFHNFEQRKNDLDALVIENINKELAKLEEEVKKEGMAGIAVPNNLNAGQALDLDGDGHSNTEELIFGSNPYNSESTPITVLNEKQKFEQIKIDFDSTKLKEENQVNYKETDNKAEDVKKYLSNTASVSSLSVRVYEKDYNSNILKEYFKDFKFADGTTLETFNPFIENESISDLIQLVFFKNQDGEYRVNYINSTSLLYDSELEAFIQKLDKNIEKVKLEENQLNDKEISKTPERDISKYKEEAKEKISNFKITNDMFPYKLTPSERLNNNLEAISMLNRIEKGERKLDINAQEILAKYVGWGGLSDVFNEEKTGQWNIARDFLKENLSPLEYESAKESTLTAFYTPKAVIDAIYKTISDMGFKSGNILEPSMGVGSFIGNIPDAMSKSKFYGIELDSISGRIAKLLYPEGNIQIKGFEETSFSNNFFDLAIGNVPFGEFKVNDREYNKNNFLIHDYFFAKSIDKVRNGGIIAFITSSGTLDKKNDSVRRYINARAEFLGAIRLPNDTFKGVAGTEVTSDIIFLKKRDRVLERDDEWVHLSEDEKGLTYNKYFVEHPEMVLGTIKEVSGRFGSIITCLPQENADFNELLAKASKEISGNAKYEEIELFNNDISKIPATDDVKNFSYTIIDNEVYYRENSIFIKKDLDNEKKEIVEDYIKLTEALKALIYKQKENFSDIEIKLSQDKLNESYDDFSKKHGFVNNNSNIKILEEDSNFPLVSSIEILDEEENFKAKGDIFYKRTIKEAIAVNHVDTSLEALVLAISEKGYVDFEYMESLTDKYKSIIIEELRGEIFLDINNKRDFVSDISFNLEDGDLPISSGIFGSSEYTYVTKDEYLSGNIRDKLNVINSYISNLRRMESKIDTLEDHEKELLKYEMQALKYQKDELTKVLPKDLTASEISVRLGTTWIPKEYIKDFIFDTLKTPGYLRWDIEVTYSPLLSKWKIKGKGKDNNNDIANITYGTSRINAYGLIEDALNLKQTQVYDTVFDANGNKNRIINKKETMLVEEKQELLKEEFKNWIFNDVTRRRTLEKTYNERFNSIRSREYDGSNLTFKGMNTDIILKPHQRNAIARVLYGGNALLAHAVGAGKTFEMVASAMESKRLGMCTKSLFVVPNHLTRQFGREFMQLYPSANIMVADKKDFEPKNRKRFVGKIATGEYDAVIIGHSQFEKIPMSKEYQEKHINEQIDEVISYLEECKRDRNQNFTVKELEKKKKSLENELRKLNDDFKKDDVITFEELGVDKLFIDEAHKYKNLHFNTKMVNVAGIPQNKAQKSSDMFMKCRYMDEMTNGKGIVFATGTPVSNSMSEIYTMQRYLQYESLKKNNFENFDSWASTFGETQTSLELSPEGTGYRVKTRFSKFYNLPELMSMFKEIADVQTADMLNLPTPQDNYEVIKTMPSDEQKEILKNLSKRADMVRNKSIDPKRDNMLKITNDGKKLALDQRLINQLLPDDQNSKVNICVKNIFDIWNKTKDDKMTQLLFSDMSTPKGDGSFNIYDDIRNKLVDMGIPKKEIAFIHEAKKDQQKDELFAKVRKSEVRILMGSTQKMGEGTNVQNKLIALHDLDVPWRPSDLEQRAGRIVRQGNENKEVNIYRYVTENTFDAYLWQVIENKQKFISQIMTSKTPVRVAEDIDESTLNYAEIKALATGNPLIKEKMDLDNEVTKLRILEANYKSNRYKLEDKVVKSYPNEIKRLGNLIEAIKKDMADIEPKVKDERKINTITILGEDINDKKLAGERLLQAISTVKIGESRFIAKYRNMNLEVNYNAVTNEHDFILKGAGSHMGTFGTSPDGNITRLNNVIDKMPSKLLELEEKLANTKEKLKNAKEELNRPFEKAEELKIKVLRLAELNRRLDMELSEDKDADEYINNNTSLESEIDKDNLYAEDNTNTYSIKLQGWSEAREYNNIYTAFLFYKNYEANKNIKSKQDIIIYKNGKMISEEELDQDVMKFMKENGYINKPLAIVDFTEANYLDSNKLYDLGELVDIVSAYNDAHENIRLYNKQFNLDIELIGGYDKTFIDVISTIDGKPEVFNIRYDIGGEGGQSLEHRLRDCVVEDKNIEKYVAELRKDFGEYRTADELNELIEERLKSNKFLLDIIIPELDRYIELTPEEELEEKWEYYKNDFYEKNKDKSIFYLNKIEPITEYAKVFYIRGEENSKKELYGIISDIYYKPQNRCDVCVNVNDSKIRLFTAEYDKTLKIYTNPRDYAHIAKDRSDFKKFMENFMKDYAGKIEVVNESTDKKICNNIYQNRMIGMEYELEEEIEV